MTRSRTTSSLYTDLQFSPRSEAVAFFLKSALPFIPKKSGARVLDLGCGTGELVFLLCRYRPDLQLFGIDISKTNIDLALARAERLPEPKRPTFVVADYFNLHTSPFDVILADSVLHLLAGDDHPLAAKLASDLFPGGVLIASLAQSCVRNYALMKLRSLWRHTPICLDGFVLNLSGLWFRPEKQKLLADRMPYMRIIPQRMFDSRLSDIFQAHGLSLATDLPCPDATILKPKHRLAVYCRARC